MRLPDRNRNIASDMAKRMAAAMQIPLVCANAAIINDSNIMRVLGLSLKLRNIAMQAIRHEEISSCSVFLNEDGSFNMNMIEKRAASIDAVFECLNAAK